MASSSNSSKPGGTLAWARRVRAASAALLVLLLSIWLLVPGHAFAQVVLAEDDGAAVSDAVEFALSGFHKAKKGSDAPLPDSAYYGYRYLTGTEPGCVTLATNDVTVVYVSASVCDEYGIQLDDKTQANALVEMLVSLDDAHSDGGTALGAHSAELVVTDEADCVYAGKRFRFDIACDGRLYAAVMDQEDSKSSARIAMFCDYAQVVARSDVAVANDSAPIESALSFLSDVDFSPLLVSVRTALLATLVVALLGIVVGWQATRAREVVQSVLDWFFSVSMVLPPTVLGFILLWLFGRYSPVGRGLIAAGIDLPFTWPAAVIAAAVVSFPYMYRAARAAFEEVDPDLLDAARTLGMSEFSIMVKLLLPLSLPALATGVVLAFARALGEFGATLFFAGNYVGQTQTLPIAKYYDWMSGDERLAVLWGLGIIVFSFVSMLTINRVAGSANRYR